MNSSGQIFSLDFLFSMVLVVLAVGLILSFLELNEYSMKENELAHELRVIGERAADLLVSSSETACRLEADTTQLGPLPGCIPKAAVISKQQLGIPQGYGVNVSFEPEGAATTTPTAPAENYSRKQNVFVAERRVVLSSNNAIKKADFEKCINGSGCALNYYTAKAVLRVWKE